MRQHRLAKKIFNDTDDPNRWVISYADFITLLFAFFVTMYALSVVNEGKYRVIADSLGLAFLNIPPLAYTLDLDTETVIPPPLMSVKPVKGALGQGALTPHSLSKPYFPEIAEPDREKLQMLADKNLIKLNETAHWMEITLNTNILFPSGSATLLKEADNVLNPISDIFADLTSPIQVEGFTDNIPIKNELFPSNWQLSTARASAVAQKFIELKIPKERLVVVGYGDNYPIATNKTLMGRAENRRVVLVVAKNPRIKRLQKATYQEPKVKDTPELRRQKLLENRPKKIEQFRLPDGRIRYTTLPERKTTADTSQKESTPQKVKEP